MLIILSISNVESEENSIISITCSLNLLSNKIVAVFDIDHLSKDHALRVLFSFSTTTNKLFEYSYIIVFARKSTYCLLKSYYIILYYILFYFILYYVVQMVLGNKKRYPFS